MNSLGRCCYLSLHLVEDVNQFKSHCDFVLKRTQQTAFFFGYLLSDELKVKLWLNLVYLFGQTIVDCLLLFFEDFPLFTFHSEALGVFVSAEDDVLLDVVDEFGVHQARVLVLGQDGWVNLEVDWLRGQHLHFESCSKRCLQVVVGCQKFSFIKQVI